MEEVCFADLKISKPTLDALQSSGYLKLTDIQKAAIPLALAGKDLLGAAKTGSGKTLAFAVPVVERMFQERFCPQLGLGALILSPTRELALQIFQVIKTISRNHKFSVGVLVGDGNSRSVAEEKLAISGLNILIATPGRLLQHMDETCTFNCDNLCMLVLDEADNIMDAGFAECVDSILQFLPKSRQTLLFSATQTRKVKDLARLELRNPEYVAVHASATESTPVKLSQAYVVCNLEQKYDLLWSFLKAHLMKKIIVFVSTCKQTRFFYETLRLLHPGTAIFHLHGKQGAQTRTSVAVAFAQAKSGVLLATDLAARGLDFPNVNWVLQLDSPVNADTYIHRVGRTARYSSSGCALLVLMPSEEETVLKMLETARVPSVRRVNAKILPITSKIAAICAQSQEIKYLAQRAFTTYLRSVPCAKDLPIEQYAESLGLAAAPKLKFLEKKISTAVCSTKFDDELFDVGPCMDSVHENNIVEISHRKRIREKQKIRKNMPGPTRTVFDDDGQACIVKPVVDASVLPESSALVQVAETFHADQRAKTRDADVLDKQQHRDRLRAKRRKQAKTLE